MIELHGDHTFTLTAGSFRLRNCRTGIRVNHAAEPVAWRSAGASELAGTSRSGSWHFALRELPDGKTELRFGGKLNAPAARLEITPLEIPELEADHLLAQGVRMGGCEAVKLPHRREKEFESHYQCMITRGGETLMLSMPLRQKQPGAFHGAFAGDRLGNIRATYVLQHFGGCEIDLDPVTVEAGDGFAMLEGWAAANAGAARDFSHAAAVGWNSWDYYRWTVTEEEVLKNAEFIARDPVLSKHVRRIVVDDGWQYCYGEWEANHLFPSGMEALAKELTKLGFEPGLWFAPSIAEPHCFFSQRDPDMLALSEGGQPCLAYECMRRCGFILDPTVPRVQKHLKELFSRYAAMGYRYFKLDFLYSTLNAPRFHDESVPRSEIVRKLIEPIHDGIAGRARILGCNYPFHCGSTMVDAVRIGADIHARRENIRNNALAAGARFWANKRLWLNDPDFALCRGPETGDDPDLARIRPLMVFNGPRDPYNPEHEMTLATAGRNEIELLLGIVLMAGGAVNLSDDMTKLNESGLELARRVVSALPGEAARPLDLFASELPSVWLQETAAGKRLMLANWEDSPRAAVVNLRVYGIGAAEMKDFWSGETVRFNNGSAELAIPAHGCRLLES